MGALSDKTVKFKPELIIKTLFFVMGFSVIFIVLSIVITAGMALMGGAVRWIGWISGVVVIILGLNIIFDFLPFLNYEKRFRLPSNRHSLNSQGTRALRGLIGAFAAGAAFGAGWTPCIGPVLAGILLLAAQSGGIPRAIVYLTFFSMGLGLPFIFTSAFFDIFLKTRSIINKHILLIRRVCGVLLVVMGITMITGHYRILSSLAAGWQNSLTKSIQSNDAPTNRAANKLTTASASVDTMSDDAIPQPVIDAFRKARLPLMSKGVKPIDFTVTLLDGTMLKLSDLKGKFALLNFWATWCGPCRAEMPSMEELYQKLEHRGFEMLAVNIMENADIVTEFIRENKIGFTVALDRNGMISRQYGIQAIPTTYIIDKRGLIISKVTGAIDWNTDGIIAALELLD